MENLRQINDKNYTPIKGDNVLLEGRYGILLDNTFSQILWVDNQEVTEWSGGWIEFINNGGYLLII
jgi:hypothetical protein